MKFINTLSGRSLKAVFGLIIGTFAGYMQIQSCVGLSPWDCFNVGLSLHTGITIGQASIAVSVVVVIADLLMKEKIGLGTIYDAIICGVFFDIFNALELVPIQKDLFSGILIYSAGIVIGSFAQWIYMSAALCCGPRDTLIVGVGRYFRKLPIGFVQSSVNTVILAAGWLLGGSVGIGTILSVFGSGAVTQLVFKIANFEPRDVVNESLADLPKRFRPNSV